jgi:hypothetical protein
MNEEKPTTFTPTKSLLYWRKSKLNGAACVPVIVSLDESKNFSMKTAEATEFSAPASSTVVAFTNWGTMVVSLNGKTYDIVGTGATTSPSPTAEQLSEVGAVDTGNQTLSNVGAAGAAAGAIDPTVGVAGSAAMQYAYYQGLEAIKAWQQELPKAGATVKASKMNAMKYFTLAIVGLLAVLFVVGLVINR